MKINLTKRDFYEENGNEERMKTKTEQRKPDRKGENQRHDKKSIGSK